MHVAHRLTATCASSHSFRLALHSRLLYTLASVLLAFVMPLVVPGSRFAERLRTAIRDDVDHLITKLLGLRQSDDEDAVNFEAALEFVYSNFDFHRCLDTDEEGITRQLVALAAKFQIHSRQRHAQALQFLAGNYLRLSPSPSHIPASPHHFNCLRFILLMSDRPTAASYSFPGLQRVQPHMWEQDVDWTDVLGERLDPYHCDYDQASDAWSQLSGDVLDSDRDSAEGFFPLEPSANSPPAGLPITELEPAEPARPQVKEVDLEASSQVGLVPRLETSNPCGLHVFYDPQPLCSLPCMLRLAWQPWLACWRLHQRCKWRSRSSMV